MADQYDGTTRTGALSPVGIRQEKPALKLDSMECKDHTEVYYAVTDRYQLTMNGKEFIVHIVENSNEGYLLWMEGEQLFTEEERRKIEEYIFEVSGEWRNK